jgi:hypothetical protein
LNGLNALPEKSGIMTRDPDYYADHSFLIGQYESQTVKRDDGKRIRREEDKTAAGQEARKARRRGLSHLTPQRSLNDLRVTNQLRRGF